jgi:branched-chain amino acid transport system permease protein
VVSHGGTTPLTVSTRGGPTLSSINSWRSKLPTTFTGIAGLVLLAAAVIVILISFLQRPSSVTQILSIGLANGAMYALIALGYTMVYGIIELINFAHGDLFMLASIFGAVAINNWFGQTSSSAVAIMLLIVAIIATMAFAATTNVTIERLAYRRLRNSPKLAPLICAVGVSFILQNLGIIWNGSQPRTRPSVLPKTKITIGSIELRLVDLVVVAVTVPILIGLTWLVQKTRTGKAMRATAQDRDASLLMGIDVDRIISTTFAIGGALAGAAGVLFVQVNGTTKYDSGFRLGLIAFTAAVLGGVGNLLGAVIGGVLIGIIQALNDAQVLLPSGVPAWMKDFTGQKWSQTVTFGILILMIIFRPGGILGSHQVEKV